MPKQGCVLVLVILIGLFGLIFSSCKKEPVKGCTDIFALNFDSEAEEDDGSCTYYTSDPEPTSVYIYSVTASPTTDECVVIKNNTSTTQDLSGWKIGDSNNSSAYTIPSITLTTGQTYTFMASTMGFQVNDSGETIYLKNSSGNTVDTWTN